MKMHILKWVCAHLMTGNILEWFYAACENHFLRFCILLFCFKSFFASFLFGFFFQTVHIHLTIVDMDIINQMVMEINIQVKSMQINIHKVCHLVMINSNMIQWVVWMEFSLLILFNDFYRQFLSVLVIE